MRTKQKARRTLREHGQASVRSGEHFKLRLYVAGQTPKSLAALSNLKRLCDQHLPGKYEIEIIDLMKDPQLAHGDQILAIPTLVRSLPEPIRKIIGDLSDTERVLVGLNLHETQLGRKHTAGA